MKEKVYAFIDSQNLNLGIKSLGWKLDFEKFYRFISDKFKVEKVYLFIGYIPKNENLYKYLLKIGYILIFKPTLLHKERNKYKIKGNVDAELVLYCAAREFSNYDSAIVVSGDGDFACLYEYLIENGKLLKLIIPNKYSYSSLLRKFMDYSLFVNGNRNKLEYRK